MNEVSDRQVNTSLVSKPSEKMYVGTHRSAKLGVEMNKVCHTTSDILRYQLFRVNLSLRGVAVCVLKQVECKSALGDVRALDGVERNMVWDPAFLLL